LGISGRKSAPES